VTLAALIILNEDRPTAPVLGLSWPEFQLRRAVRAGALHLVLVSDRVTRDVVEAVDRLRGEGLSTTLARSNAEVADLFHPDEAVLLLTGDQIVGDDQLAALLQASGPTLLCIDPERAGPAHELIDARSHWVGIGRLNGAQVRATVPLSGDWDLGSTLMRKAVGARAKRMMVTPEDMLLPAAQPEAAARAMIGTVKDQSSGWGNRWIISPTSRLIARSFPATLPMLARIGSLIALAAFALSPFAQWWHWSAAALGLFLFGLLMAVSSGLAGAVTGIPVRHAQLIGHCRDAAGMLLLAIIVVQLLPDLAPAVLALAAVGLLGLAGRISDAGASHMTWFADIGGTALILLVATAFGPLGVIAGLFVAAVHAFVTVAILQNRLSRALTSPR